MIGMYNSTVQVYKGTISCNIYVLLLNSKYMSFAFLKMTKNNENELIEQIF